MKWEWKLVASLLQHLISVHYSMKITAFCEHGLVWYETRSGWFDVRVVHKEISVANSEVQFGKLGREANAS